MKEKFNFNQNLLKLTSIVSMTIDHAGKLLFDSQDVFGTHLGRIAMPIFAFLLVYNYLYHTKNPINYIKRIFLFGIISQVPFIMAFNLPPIFLNILFSLAFIALTLMVTGNKVKTSNLGYYLVILGLLALYLLIRKFNVPLHFEYGFTGLAFGVSIYTFLVHRTPDYFAYTLIFLYLLNESVVSFILLMIYLPPIFFLANKNMRELRFVSSYKFLFYAYYPLHLLLLVLMSKLIG